MPPCFLHAGLLKLNGHAAVATPFDVKNGRGQIPGVSSVGHSTHNSSMGTSADEDDYHIKFTFAASPLAKHSNSTVSSCVPQPA